jgi:hypothetical protein
MNKTLSIKNNKEIEEEALLKKLRKVERKRDYLID